MNMTYTFQTKVIQKLSDTHTPVELYLKIRDKFAQSFLLESSDYKSKEDSFSYLCFDERASFKADKERVFMTYPDGKTEQLNTQEVVVSEVLNRFSQSFVTEDLGYNFVTNGLFGYTSYDAIPLFEDIQFSNNDFDLPLIQYHVFKYLIVFNHFNNELYLIEHLLEGEKSGMDEMMDIIENRSIPRFEFKRVGEESSNFTDEDFLKVIHKGIDYCHYGDVFQVVMSRKFRQSFSGDEFNVYRALRSINPSPYLFYFDYGSFKIFGSSPEAQLTINQDVAAMNPIAGTFKRTGNSEQDRLLAEELLKDPKENAEHIMLVDLARNDLSKNSKEVKVERYKEIEYYSHVIHLVSRVTAKLEGKYNPIEILGNTYPAGTLSGAPKYRAMEIIDKYEPNSRGFYGGAVGYLGFRGEFNHAIFIRSFVSKNNELTLQAGCGIVAKSNPESELNEVNNKLSALRKALELATTIA
jgi:anthranilate synthase component I